MITAFLQCPWFKPGTSTRTIEKFKSNHEFRRRLLYNSYSGKRLVKCFGELLKDFFWEEASLEVGSVSSAKFPANHEHIRTVLDIRRPVLVIAFGTIASDALQEIWSGPLICLPHPAARVLRDQLYFEAAKLIRTGIDQRVKFKLSKSSGHIIEALDEYTGSNEAVAGENEAVAGESASG